MTQVRSVPGVLQDLLLFLGRWIFTWALAVDWDSEVVSVRTKMAVQKRAQFSALENQHQKHVSLCFIMFHHMLAPSSSVPSTTRALVPRQESTSTIRMWPTSEFEPQHRGERTGQYWYHPCYVNCIENPNTIQRLFWMSRNLSHGHVVPKRPKATRCHQINQEVRLVRLVLNHWISMGLPLDFLISPCLAGCCQVVRPPKISQSR